MSLPEHRVTHLKALEAESMHIFREVAAEFDNPVMLYSVGKDSSVLLHLSHPCPKTKSNSENRTPKIERQQKQLTPPLCDPACRSCRSRRAFPPRPWTRRSPQIGRAHV